MTQLAGQVAAAERLYRLRPAVQEGERRWTMADVTDRSNRAAHVLRGLVGEGLANVACLIGNCGEAVELDVALVKAGLARLSINPRLAADERDHVLMDSEARVLIYRSEDADYAEHVAGWNPDLRLLRIDGGLHTSTGRRKLGVGYEEALAYAASSPGWYPSCASDPSVIMYTSGTTGRPKGAVWTVASRAAGIANLLACELDAPSARRMVHAGSLAHGSGSRVLPILLRGGCNVVMRRFDPGELLRIARNQSATSTFLVPTMVQALIEAVISSVSPPPPSLSHITYGGAKMPLPTIEAALEVMGPRFVQVYGSCEAPNPILLLDRADHAEGHLRRLESAGRPVPGAEVRVGRGEDRIGELLVRADSVFAGYWRNPAATEAVFTDGFYRTGDLATMHADGYVEITGRAREVIISGGYNVYPAEVERVLLEHPGVQAACAYGLEDPRWVEAVAATVVPVADWVPDEQELVAHCRARLAGYKLPRSVVFTGGLPVGATGKVLRAEVRRRHASQPRRKS